MQGNKQQISSAPRYFRQGNHIENAGFSKVHSISVLNLELGSLCSLVSGAERKKLLAVSSADLCVVLSAL